jgi:general transcription factor 3C polypeptide 3 (transcription factor C subunit 4)
MKFMLRQIKAMDFTLPELNDRPNRARQSIWKERASLSTRDEEGEPIPAKNLDAALLVLYGHMLYAGGSFYPALNYFFRAYALDDQNPGILFSIALSYINQSFKRQSENRHYLIMQGLSFMDEYRRVREKPGTILPERQEMEFNFARVYHGLGLTHLAIEAYNKVLKLGDEIQQNAQQDADGIDVVMGEANQAPGTSTATSKGLVEDFSHEAAFALQTLHVLAGDAKLAKEVTDKWLVI